MRVRTTGAARHPHCAFRRAHSALITQPGNVAPIGQTGIRPGLFGGGLFRGLAAGFLGAGLFGLLNLLD